MGFPLHVAVFPLPKIVAFPGHSLQFHIFEPRYRKMVRDCVETGLWVAVAQGDLTKKARVGQTLEEFLNTNQETYTPVEVFGMGPLRVLKELPDGRFVVEIDIRGRGRARACIQELPYELVEVEHLTDVAVALAEEARLLTELRAETGRIASLRTGLLKHLQSKEYFDDSSLSSLVYSVLKWFVIENTEGQTILEDDNPAGRAEKLLAWMRYFVREASIHDVRGDASRTGAEGRPRKARRVEDDGSPSPDAFPSRRGRESPPRAGASSHAGSVGHAGTHEERETRGARLAREAKEARARRVEAAVEEVEPGGRVLHVDFGRRN
jgi:Lon protease-like protein